MKARESCWVAAWTLSAIVAAEHVDALVRIFTFTLLISEIAAHLRFPALLLDVRLLL